MGPFAWSEEKTLLLPGFRGENGVAVGVPTIMMINVATNRELSRSLGGFKTQPTMTTDNITVARIAEAGHPVSAT